VPSSETRRTSAPVDATFPIIGFIPGLNDQSESADLKPAQPYFFNGIAPNRWRGERKASWSSTGLREGETAPLPNNIAAIRGR